MGYFFSTSIGPTLAKINTAVFEPVSADTTMFLTIVGDTITHPYLVTQKNNIHVFAYLKLIS